MIRKNDVYFYRYIKRYFSFDNDNVFSFLCEIIHDKYHPLNMIILLFCDTILFKWILMLKYLIKRGAF